MGLRPAVTCSVPEQPLAYLKKIEMCLESTRIYWTDTRDSVTGKKKKKKVLTTLSKKYPPSHYRQGAALHNCIVAVEIRPNLHV